MAKGLLTLAKGATPDSAGWKHPFSHGRLRCQPVLPQCPIFIIIIVVIIIIIMRQLKLLYAIYS